MKKTQNHYRRFSFGRRASDKRECYICPTNTENVSETARKIIMAMSSSIELREHILSEIQKSCWGNEFV